MRRIASYLQARHCLDACDAALHWSVLNGLEDEIGLGPLGGVLQLYTCRSEWLGFTEDSMLPRNLLHACRQQLIEHSDDISPAPSDDPSLGELLGWAFGDAPSVLSDPEVRQQMEQLSAAAMGALLGSETLATDDESSVLLLLATWLRANPDTHEDDVRWLCSLIRLIQLTDSYLTSVLPRLSWFALSSQEHSFLCEYKRASAPTRARLLEQAQDRFFLWPAWYSAPPRPATHSRSGQQRSYTWSIDAQTLRRWLEGASDYLVGVQFADEYGGGPCGGTVVAGGLEWGVLLGLSGAQGQAGPCGGLYLQCRLPPALCVRGPYPVLVVGPGSARLAAHRWRSGGVGGRRREEACQLDCGELLVGVGSPDGADMDARGFPGTLPLEAVAAPAQQHPGGGGREPASEGAAGTAGGSTGNLPQPPALTAAVTATSAVGTGQPGLGEGTCTGSLAGGGGSAVGQPADPLAAWSAYLHDNGKVSGVLEWVVREAAE